MLMATFKRWLKALLVDLLYCFQGEKNMYLQESDTIILKITEYKGKKKCPHVLFTDYTTYSIK